MPIFTLRRVSCTPVRQGRRTHDGGDDHLHRFVPRHRDDGDHRISPGKVPGPYRSVFLSSLSPEPHECSGDDGPGLFSTPRFPRHGESLVRHQSQCRQVQGVRLLSQSSSG